LSRGDGSQTESSLALSNQRPRLIAGSRSCPLPAPGLDPDPAFPANHSARAIRPIMPSRWPFSLAPSRHVSPLGPPCILGRRLLAFPVPSPPLPSFARRYPRSDCPFRLSSPPIAPSLASRLFCPDLHCLYSIDGSDRDTICISHRFVLTSPDKNTEHCGPGRRLRC